MDSYPSGATAKINSSRLFWCQGLVSELLKSAVKDWESFFSHEEVTAKLPVISGPDLSGTHRERGWGEIDRQTETESETEVGGS